MLIHVPLLKHGKLAHAEYLTKRRLSANNTNTSSKTILSFSFLVFMSCTSFGYTYTFLFRPDTWHPVHILCLYLRYYSNSRNLLVCLVDWYLRTPKHFVLSAYWAPEQMFYLLFYISPTPFATILYRVHMLFWHLTITVAVCMPTWDDIDIVHVLKSCLSYSFIIYVYMYFS